MTLTQMRLKSQYKMKKFEKELGVSRQQIYNLEKGLNRLDHTKIVKLSQLHGVSVEEIQKAWLEGKEKEKLKESKIVQAS